MAETPRILSDRYELGGRLGSGGMATVYAATDRVLERQVAVKLLASNLAGDEELVERFRREARASAGLNHPNVVSVFDTGSHDGTHYIVMELVEGQTLSDLLRKNGPLPPGRAAAIASGVARALESAHERGLVHRDVKPGNVLLTEEGDVKVADFGIAHAAAGTSLTATGTVLGTASYLSPEQASGELVDARSDIYSLGCVLYEMLTGRAPFTGDSPVAVATRHVSEEVPPPSSIADGVPEELEAVTMRALAKDPEARFRSAGEMASALDAAVTGEPTQGLAVAGGDAPTEAIHPGEGTAVMPAPDRTSPMPVASPAPGTARNWWPWALAALGLALMGFLLARALVGDPLSEVSDPARDPAAPASPEPSPPPASPPVLSVAEAHAAFLEVVAQADEATGIQPNRRDELVAKEAKALEHYENGDLKSALGELGAAQELVAKATVEGTIVDQWADPISTALTNVGVAMQAPPPEQEGGEKGKGNAKGEGKGEGKGKDKDDDDDD